MSISISSDVINDLSKLNKEDCVKFFNHFINELLVFFKNSLNDHKNNNPEINSAIDKLDTYQSLLPTILNTNISLIFELFVEHIYM